MGSRIPYLMMPNDIKDNFKMGVKNFLTLFVLFNTFVPISLYVTIEFIKLLQVPLRLEISPPFLTKLMNKIPDRE